MTSNPALAPHLHTLGEELCASGWTGVVIGQPDGMRTFLVPYRFWYQPPGGGHAMRGTVVACSLDGSLVVVDVMDGTPHFTLPTSSVVGATLSQEVFRVDPTPLASSPVEKWVRFLVDNGFKEEDACGQEVLFPPRCIAINDAGSRGWIVGWAASSESFIVSTGLWGHDVVAGPAAAQSTPGVEGASPSLVRMPLTAVVATNGWLPRTKLTDLRSFFEESAAPVIVTVDGSVFPAPRCIRIPNAYFAHLIGGRGVVPKDSTYPFTCPGDVCRVFASDSVFVSIDPLDCAAWDIGAILPTVLACKRVRQALKGASLGVAYLRTFWLHSVCKRESRSFSLVLWSALLRFWCMCVPQVQGKQACPMPISSMCCRQSGITATASPTATSVVGCPPW